MNNAEVLRSRSSSSAMCPDQVVLHKLCHKEDNLVRVLLPVPRGGLIGHAQTKAGFKPWPPGAAAATDGGSGDRVAPRGLARSQACRRAGVGDHRASE